MSLIDRLDRIDPRVIYVLLLVVMSVTLLRPVGLAITPGDDALRVYQTMDSLPAGSIVWLGMDFAPSASPELLPGAVAAVRHGLSKGLRFIAGSTVQVQSGNITAQLWDMICKENSDAKYGVDFVNLGYRPGEAVFYEKMLVDAKEALMGVDNYGSSLEDFAIMQDFATLKDAKAVLTFISALGVDQYIAHITDPNDIPLLVGAVAVEVSRVMPFATSGQVKGLLKGMRGSAEYEIITGRPGQAVAGMDCQSFAHLLLIVFVIVGNLGYAMSKRTPKPATN